MAGIVITLGENAREKHLFCTKEFDKAKNLPLGTQEISDLFCLSKYRRKSDADDATISTDAITIWSLGFPIYRNLTGREALTVLNEDLKNQELSDITEYLDGHFVLIIKNKLQDSFWIITDPVGILGIYKYERDDNIAFSTSSLALSRTFPVTPSTDSIVQFLRTGSICDLDTIYEEIKVLRPASTYRISFGHQLQVTLGPQYWENPILVEDHLSFDKACESLRQVLTQEMELLAAQDAIFDLTAGFDSRLILSALLNEATAPQNIHTFVFGPNRSREVLLVKECCRVLGIQNRHLSLPTNWNELFFDYFERALSITDGDENACVYAPILWANEYKARHFSCSVNGLGGELYRDFWWIQEITSSKRPANLKRLIKTRVLQYEYDYSIFSDYWKKLMSKSEDILLNRYQGTNANIDTSKTYNTMQIDNIYLRQKLRRWASRTISSSNQLLKTIAPLTFRTCLEHGMRVPPNLKRNGKLVKGVVERNSSELAKQIMLGGTPCLNLQISNLPEFWPALTTMGKKIARKVWQRCFNKTILLDKTLNYDVHPWFASLLSDVRCRNLISYEEMFTKELYHKDRLTAFVQSAEQPGFPYYTQLGNMLTLEFRMRSDHTDKLK